MPINAGFDRSYYIKDQGRFFNSKILYKNDKRLPAVKANSGYYTTTALADDVIKNLQDHAANYTKQPFFNT